MHNIKALGRNSKVLLVSDDVFLCQGIQFSPAMIGRVKAVSFAEFCATKIDKGVIVLLDILSRQVGGVNHKKSLTQYLYFFERLVLITCTNSQKRLADILYPETPKIVRNDLPKFLNALLFKNTTYENVPLHEKKRNRNLTRRELEIIQEFIIGNKSDFISNKLNINDKTVNTHKLSALEKIGCKNMAHLLILSRPFTDDLVFLCKKNRKSLESCKIYY